MLNLSHSARELASKQRGNRYLFFGGRLTRDEGSRPEGRVGARSRAGGAASSICSVGWDLVVFDESHLLVRGQRRQLLNGMLKSDAVRRALLLSSVPVPPLGDAVTVIPRKEIVDWSGRRLLPPLRRKLDYVHYRRTEEERVFLGRLSQLAKRLDEKGSYGRFQSLSLLRTGSSSLYTAEWMLHRLQDLWRPMRNKIVHGVAWTEEDIEKAQRLTVLADEVEVEEEFREGIQIEPEEFLALYKELEKLIENVEEIPKDSKVDALTLYLKKSLAANTYLHICIWCSFIRTVEYLRTTFSDMGIDVFVLTGSVAYASRREVLDAFRDSGRVLITTDVASEGMAFEHVDESILYDLPLSSIGLEQRWGRFDRIGRTSPFSMTVLKDESGTLEWEASLLEMLERGIVEE